MNGKSARLVLRIPRYFVLGMLMTAFLALFVAPEAMAGCKNGKGRCKNPPPDNTTASHGFSDASFDAEGNMHVKDGGYLSCESGADLTVANGDYFCSGPGGSLLPEFHISTASFTGLFSNRYREICGSFGNKIQLGGHNFAMLTPDEVSYGWRDDCTDGSCRIEISMKFSGPDIRAETSDKADQLSIVLGGWVFPTLEDEANPFYKQKRVFVDVDSATLEFGLTGKKRSVGFCPFGVDKDDDYQSVTFISIDP